MDIYGLHHIVQHIWGQLFRIQMLLCHSDKPINILRLYTSRRNFQIRTLLNIFFDPFFQGGLCLNLDGWLFIFQVVAGENGILSIVVLKWKPPKPNFLCVLRLRFFKMFLQVVADGIGVLVSDLRKNLSQW